MISEEQQVILFIAAYLLDYPEKNRLSEYRELKDLYKNDVDSQDAENLINLVFNDLESYSLKDIQQLYVSTFDWQEDTGLYLTAHEYGDDSMRGGGLIQIQVIISQAGLERDEKQLADYLPSLYELLAVSTDEKIHNKLMKRLGKATWQVNQSLDKKNPYKNILNLLTDFVFDKPTTEEMEEIKKEDPDTENMPYPIMYE